MTVLSYPSCTFVERCYILLLVKIRIADPGGRSIAGIVGSNSTEGMDVRLLCFVHIV